MEAPVSPSDMDTLIKLLSSGGSAGVLFIVYIAFQLKKSVEAYLSGVNETLALLGRRIRRIERHLKLAEDEE